MLTLIAVMFAAVVSAAAAVEYWLWLRRRFGAGPEERADDQRDKRRLSLATESLATVGAIFVLAGSGISISQHWLSVTSAGRFGILACVAICFLIAGFVVRWLTGSDTQRLTELMWCASAGCVTGAAVIATAGIYRQTASVTVTIAGAALAMYAAPLWLLCRREALLVATFAGSIGAFCGLILVVATQAAPLLAAALGLWLLGTAWAILGWLYPEPLGTSISAGVALALLAPAIAVHNAGWIYVMAIATAAAAMAASVPLRNVVVVAFGSCALFCYITAAVLRYANRSLGVSGSLVMIGLVLIGLAIVTVRLGRATSAPFAMSAPPDRSQPEHAQTEHAQTEQEESAGHTTGHQVQAA